MLQRLQNKSFSEKFRQNYQFHTSGEDLNLDLNLRDKSHPNFHLLINLAVRGNEQINKSINIFAKLF